MKTLTKIAKPYKKRLSTTKYVRSQKCDGRISADLYLFMKWAYRVGKGWYGFALGDDVPFVWAQVIDDFLTEVEKVAPNFEIHQIKLKFGGLRFYVDLKLDDAKVREKVQSEISALEELLFSNDLIY